MTPTAMVRAAVLAMLCLASHASAQPSFFKKLQDQLEEAVSQVGDQSDAQRPAGQGPAGTFSTSKLHGFFTERAFDGTVNGFPRVAIGFPDGEPGGIGGFGPNQDWVGPVCWTVDATIWWDMETREDGG